jgi:hypothetical protein
VNTSVPFFEEALGFIVLHARKPEVDTHLNVQLDPHFLHQHVQDDRIRLENGFRLIYLGFQRLLVREQGQEIVCNAIKRG